MAALPFLAAALLRHLEQFPTVGSGLSRTERQILQAVAKGVQQPIPLFLEDQRQEARVFMGDTVFWSYTEPARAVREGGVDYRDHQPIDRWLGGVHLQGQGRWRWDLVQRRIISNTTE